MPAGGGRVKVLFGPICSELLLGGPCGCVSKARPGLGVFKLRDQKIDCSKNYICASLVRRL